MVSVSRGAVRPSSFRVVVADNGESIENPRGSRRGCRAFLITLHQRGRRRKLAERTWQSEEIQRVGTGPRQGRKEQIYLLTIVVITSIIMAEDPGGGL